MKSRRVTALNVAAIIGCTLALASLERTAEAKCLLGLDDCFLTGSGSCTSTSPYPAQEEPHCGGSFDAEIDSLDVSGGIAVEWADTFGTSPTTCTAQTVNSELWYWDGTEWDLYGTQSVANVWIPASSTCVYGFLVWSRVSGAVTNGDNYYLANWTTGGTGSEKKVEVLTY